VDNSRLGKLHHCTECSGVWIYSALFVIFRVDILNMAGLPHVVVVNSIIGGAIISFLMNLLEIGFRERFMTITIE
jgi:hypothetical protein